MSTIFVAMICTAITMVCTPSQIKPTTTYAICAKEAETVVLPPGKVIKCVALVGGRR